MRARQLSPRRLWLFRLAIPLLSLLVTLSIVEIVMRVMVEDHPRRVESLWGVALTPYRKDHFFDTAAAEAQQSYLVRDSQLGWTIKAHAKAKGLPYISNRHGLRSVSAEVDLLEGPRVAVFGDSFTHCDEVGCEDSWPYLLEQEFLEHGQVLNGGVCGYGADQAWLRYRTLKGVLQPDIVVLGLATTAFKRNVNIFRLLVGEWTTWTKPRFVLEKGELVLINSPTLKAQQAWGCLAGGLPLSEHEYWYDPGDWAWSLEDHSFLVRYLHRKGGEGRSRGDLYRPGGEPFDVTLAIVDGFRKEVESDGAKFLCLIINHRPLTGPGESRWGKLVKAIRSLGIESINASRRLHDLKDRPELLAPQGHYARLGNRVIARVAAKRISPWIQELVQGENDQGK